MGAAGASALALLAVYDPHQAGSYGFCPFKAITGLPCPGCGGLRSMNLLLHGDFAAAASSNLLAVAVLAVGSIAWAIWFLRRLRGRPAELFTWQARTWTFIAILVMVFWLARLTPWGSWLAP